MDLDKLNQWLTLLANLGVLFGLAILIFEINQTNVMIEAQAAQARADSATNVALARIDSPGFAEALVAEDKQSLSDADKYRLGQHVFLWWRQVENLHYQIEIGVLEPEQARLGQVVYTLFSYAQTGWWARPRERPMDPELRSYMDRVSEEFVSGNSKDGA